MIAQAAGKQTLSSGHGLTMSVQIPSMHSRVAGRSMAPPDSGRNSLGFRPVAALPLGPPARHQYPLAELPRTLHLLWPHTIRIRKWSPRGHRSAPGAGPLPESLDPQALPVASACRRASRIPPSRLPLERRPGLPIRRVPDVPAQSARGGPSECRNGGHARPGCPSHSRSTPQAMQGNCSSADSAEHRTTGSAVAGP